MPGSEEIARVIRETIELDYPDPECAILDKESIERTATAIAALYADEWQDFSTAPKDGTVIDVWVQSSAPASPDGGDLSPSVGSRIPNIIWFLDKWSDIGGWPLDLRDFKNPVLTHWRRVPAPPAIHTSTGSRSNG